MQSQHEKRKNGMIDSNETRPEIFIDLISNRATGRYAFEIRGHHPVARMACGFVRNATRHTLLGFGLASALRTMSHTAIAKLYLNNKECQTFAQARRHTRKVRVRVRCSDSEFLAMCEQASTGRRNRCAKNLFDELQTQMARFAMTYQRADELDLSKIKHWSSRVLPESRDPDGFPLPTTVSTI
jgi:uncharacterized protein YecE (DUF72 family)